MVFTSRQTRASQYEHREHIFCYAESMSTQITEVCGKIQGLRGKLDAAPVRIIVFQNMFYPIADRISGFRWKQYGVN